MTFLSKLIRASPIHARFVPFALIVGLLLFQDTTSGSGRYWMYLVRMLVGAWCIREMRPMVPEMRWAFSWEAVVAGVAVCFIWIALDPFYPKIEILFKDGEKLVGRSEAYNPQKPGFFLFPADPKSNNVRIFIVNKNVHKVNFI